MRDFELPTNIKQIGSINDGLRIYVEDYVCTYLKQYAESGEQFEKIAFLVGKYLIIDSQPVVFISGAIQGKYSKYENGIEIFTDMSFEYAEEEINKFFRGYEIVGWMQSQPGYSVFLNPAYEKYHMNNFRKHYQSIFVLDPLEKTNMFYTWDDNKNELVETGGYFIYYDKNQGMQDYMIENREANLGMKEKEIRFESSEKKKTKKRNISQNEQKNRQNPKMELAKPPSPPRKKTETYENKKVINMLVTFSAVMVVTCCILGAGLVKNEGRIKQLETSLKSVNDSYENMLSLLKQGVQPVFASQDDETGNVLIFPEDNSNEYAEIENNDSLDENKLQENEFVNNDISTDEPENNAESNDENNNKDSDKIKEEDNSEKELQTNKTNEKSDSKTSSNNTNQSSSKNSIPETYVVQKGDNLNYISKKFYGSIDMAEKIMEINNMSDPDTLYFGKVIKLPRK